MRQVLVAVAPFLTVGVAVPPEIEGVVNQIVSEMVTEKVFNTTFAMEQKQGLMTSFMGAYAAVDQMSQAGGTCPDAWFKTKFDTQAARNDVLSDSWNDYKCAKDANVVAGETTLGSFNSIQAYQEMGLSPGNLASMDFPTRLAAECIMAESFASQDIAKDPALNAAMADSYKKYKDSFADVAAMNRVIGPIFKIAIEGVLKTPTPTAKAVLLVKEEVKKRLFVWSSLVLYAQAVGGLIPKSAATSALHVTLVANIAIMVKLQGAVGTTDADQKNVAAGGKVLAILMNCLTFNFVSTGGVDNGNLELVPKAGLDVGDAGHSVVRLFTHTYSLWNFRLLQFLYGPGYTGCSGFNPLQMAYKAAYTLSLPISEDGRGKTGHYSWMPIRAMLTGIQYLYNPIGDKCTDSLISPETIAKEAVAAKEAADAIKSCQPQIDSAVAAAEKAAIATVATNTKNLESTFETKFSTMMTKLSSQEKNLTDKVEDTESSVNISIIMASVAAFMAVASLVVLVLKKGGKAEPQAQYQSAASSNVLPVEKQAPTLLKAIETAEKK